MDLEGITLDDNQLKNIDNFCLWMDYENYYAYNINPDEIRKHLCFYTMFLKLQKQNNLKSFIPYNNGIKKKKNIISFINNRDLNTLTPNELREIIVYDTNITMEKLKSQNKSKTKLIKQIKNLIKNVTQ